MRWASVAQRQRPLRVTEMVGRRRDGDWSGLLAGGAVGVWGWRLELAVVIAIVAAQQLLAPACGEFVAAGLVVVVVASVLAIGAVRRRLVRLLRGVRLRRAWRRAVSDVGLAVDVLRAPRVLDVRRIAAGDLLRVRV